MEVNTVEAAVVDGDFNGGVGRESIKDSAVSHKHIFLILTGGQGIVNVGKAPCLGVLPINQPDTVFVNALDWNSLLNTSRNTERTPLTSVCGL